MLRAEYRGAPAVVLIPFAVQPIRQPSRKIRNRQEGEQHAITRKWDDLY